METVAEVCARWRLTPGERFEGGMCAEVLSVTGPGGLDAVLKVQYPDRESAYEADALRAWDGDGAVRLLDHDPEHHALLLERCRPGLPLSEAAPTTALPVLADLVRRLAVPVPATASFTTLADEAAHWRDGLPRTWEQAGRPFPAVLVEQALDLLDRLAPTQGPPVLLHQDLHGDNVLAAQREPWLVIDPKPLIGELAFALAPIVRSAELGHSREAVVHRLDFLSDALGVDRERARGWAVAQTMAWVFDGLEPIEGHLDVVRWLLAA